jgi:coenzyme F420-reducing hydrogenase delta subunit
MDLIGPQIIQHKGNMSRGGFKITRTSMGENSGDRVDWLDSFARRIEEVSKLPVNAVEQARNRDQRSMLDQISAIVSKQSKHSTVEAKVQDYQDKIGLKEYLKRMSLDKEVERKKIAQEDIDELPEYFNKFSDKIREDIKNFIRNKCDTHHGNIQVPALVEDVSKIFRQVGVQPQDVNDMQFEKYISDQIVKSKNKNPSTNEHNVNLGLGVGVNNTDIDSSNINIFEGLNPVKSS